LKGRSMKKVFLVFVLAITSGCGPSAFQVRTDDLNSRLLWLKSRQTLMFAESERVSEKESAFVKQLNDNQLAAYQATVQAFKSNDYSTQEMSRRDLERVCDPNIYSEAMLLLERKKWIRQESGAIGVEQESIRRELASMGEELNRRRAR